VYHLVNIYDICYIDSEVIEMATGKGRKRILITLSENIIDKAKMLAEADKRTLSNYIEKLLEDAIKKK